MADYGFKTLSQIKVMQPFPCPICTECGAQLRFEKLDKVRSVAVLSHPLPPIVINDPCPYANRRFEMELDIRYLKEVAP